MIIGPSIIRDGLVFGYDADDRSTRFYKGEPTTNYLLKSTNPNSAVKESFVGSIVENSVIAPDGTLTAHTFNVTSGYVYENLTIPPGTTITYSVWIKTLDGTTTTSYGPYIWNRNSPTNGIVKRDLSGVSPNWKRMIMTYTTLSHQTSFAISYGGSNGGMIGNYALWNPQLEYKNHATQFTTDTRLSTQSLSNLANKLVKINISPLSFDWKGNPYFYNSGISLGSIFNLNDYFVNNGSFTIETYIRIDLVRNRGAVFNNQRYLSEADPAGFGLVIENSPPKFGLNLTNSTPSSYENLAGIPIQKAKYQHIVYVYEPGVVKSYLNGVLYATATNSSYSWSIASNSIRTHIGVGTQGGWGSVNGMDIKTLKVYNKPLTQKDVEQNYNVVKSRFNTENELNSGIVLNLDAGNKNSLISGGTTWYDLTGINNGTLINNPVFSDVPEGLTFDGVNQYIQLAQSVNLYSWTIICDLYYIYKSKTSEFFIGSNNGDSTGKILLSNNGKISFRNGVYYDFSRTSNSINNTFSNLCFVSNGINISLYVNGVFDSTITPNSTYLPINTIGNAWTDLVWLSSFKVCKLKVYNRDLTSSEIIQLFEKEKRRFNL